MIEFSLDGQEYIELHNLLKVVGLVHSGGLAKSLIADGLVLVDDTVEYRKRCKIRTGQKIQFQDEIVQVIE